MMANQIPARSDGGDQAPQPLVLLAEDNEINIETMIDFLDFGGFRTVIARNGQEAIDLAVEKMMDGYRQRVHV